MASLLQPVRAVWDFFDFLRQPAVSFVDPALKDKIDSSLLENCKPHHREVVQMVLTDMYGRRKEAIVRLPARMEAYIRDHMLADDRDYLTALTFLQVTVWAVFSAVVQLLLIPQEYSYYWVLPHLAVTWGLLAQRFILAMHYAAHRPIFSTKKCGAVATVLNAIPQTLLSNYYGLPAGAYYLHHCVMHHQANNFFPYDISSTMPYDRSNPLHFIVYVLNFMLHTFFYLPFYAVQKRRYQLAAVFAGTFCVYSYIFRGLYNWHPAFFLAQFGISFVIGPVRIDICIGIGICIYIYTCIFLAQLGISFVIGPVRARALPPCTCTCRRLRLLPSTASAFSPPPSLPSPLHRLCLLPSTVSAFSPPPSPPSPLHRLCLLPSTASAFSPPPPLPSPLHRLYPLPHPSK